MSASEKLKALDPKADVDYGPAPFAAYVLLNAFPHIVAVVEAAEGAKPYADGEAELGVAYTAYTIPTDRMIRLDLALAALGEALS